MKNKWLSLFKPKVDPALIRDVLMKLHEVSSKSDLEKVAWLVIARKSNSTNEGMLRQAFDELDTNHDGSISFDELKNAMIRELGSQNFLEIEHTFQLVDIQHRKYIDYTTFVAALLEVKYHEEYVGEHSGAIRLDDYIEDVFDHFDLNQCGYITHDDIRQVMGNQISEAFVDNFIEEIDIDHSGKVSLEDFKKAFQKQNTSVID